MSKKTSLGHNPLAYSLKSHASFDFIKSTKDNTVNNIEEPVIQKKVVSYYLEKPVIDKIKVIAKEKKESYSCLVNEFLKASIKREEASE